MLRNQSVYLLLNLAWIICLMLSACQAPTIQSQPLNPINAQESAIPSASASLTSSQRANAIAIKPDLEQLGNLPSEQLCLKQADPNHPQLCQTLLNPESITLSSAEIIKQVKIAHALLADNLCQESQNFYKQAYQKELNWIARGYLAQRLVQAHHCLSGQVSFERQSSLGKNIQSAPGEQTVFYEMAKLLPKELPNLQTFQERLKQAQDALVEQNCSQANLLYQELLATPELSLEMQGFLKAQQRWSTSCPVIPSPPLTSTPGPDEVSPTPTEIPSSNNSSEPSDTPSPKPTTTSISESNETDTGGSSTGGTETEDASTDEAEPEPVRPQGLEASLVTHQGLTLNWTAINEASHYRVYLNGQVRSVETDTISLITGLQSSSTYQFQVSAIISGIESALSEPLAVTTLATPQNLSFSTQVLSSTPLQSSRLNLRRLIVSGNYAYLTDTQRGLMVMDIRNPAQPLLKAQSGNMSNPEGLFVDNQTLYVANGKGLTIFNVSNPAQPVQIGHYATAAASHSLKKVGSLVYLAAGSLGLQILDVSQPSSPQLVGAYDTPGTAWNLAVSGNRVYIADSTGGLQIVDVSQAAQPTLLGNYPTSVSLSDVAIAGTKALLALGNNGLQVVDVTSPDSPQLLGSLTGIGAVTTIAIEGQKAYLGGSGGFKVVDFNNPAEPNVLQSVNASFYGMAIKSNLLFLTQSSEFKVLDLNQNGAVVGEFRVAVSGNATGVPHDVEVRGNYAYVGGAFGGFFILDISNPSAPWIASRLDLGDVRELRVVGNYAYVTAKQNGLKIVDISNPYQPLVVGTYLTTAGQSGGLSVVGNRVYIADNPGGIQIIDVSDPSQPVLLGKFVPPGEAWGVDVVGNYAYVANYLNGLTILDVSNPAAPVQVGHLQTAGQAWEVQVIGDLAYVVGVQAGLQIIDVSDPSQPIAVGSYRAANPNVLNVYGVHVVGKYAYLGTIESNTGLQILDVENPAQPRAITNQKVAGSIVRLQIVGNLAYIAQINTSQGLQIVKLY